VDGAGLVVMFLGIWLSLARGRLRIGRALLLLPLGALVALGANVVRIAALVWLGGSGHEELAYGGFHSKLGWVIFLGLALGGVALAERAPWLQRAGGAAAAPAAVPDAAGAYLGPLLAALAAALLTGLWSTGPFDPWYGARATAAVLILLAVRRSLPPLLPRAREALAPALIGLAACAAWLAWPAGDGGALAEWLARLSPAARAAWLAVRVLGSVLVVPLVEELAFRGFLLPWLVSPDFEAVPPRAFTATAVVLSSVAFGALHQSWVLGALAGLAFAAARLRRGRLADAVLAHAVCNAGVAAAALWGGRLDLWS
jgi:exosortase E/protease (VPEID-CTERM system)